MKLSSAYFANIRLLAVVLMLFGAFASCSQKYEIPKYVMLPFDTAKTVTFEEVVSRDTLRILDIGNSYSDDYTNMLNSIARNLHVDLSKVCYYKLNRDSGSFTTWSMCYNSSDKLPYWCVKVTGDLTLPIEEKQYEANDGSGMRRVLDLDWDLIIIHQVSTFSNNYSLWNTLSEGGNLYDFMTMLTYLQPRAAFAFELIHSYAGNFKYNTEHSSSQRWNNICNATEQMLMDYPLVSCIIPCGTAIQNLRLTSLNNAAEFTRDGSHLGYGLARYAAACALYETVLYPRTGVSVIGTPFERPCTPEEYKNAKYPEGCYDVTLENCVIAQRAANAAIIDPYHLHSPE